jgi:hypothetical protein
MSISADLAHAFLVQWKEFCWQWPQAGLFNFLKLLADMPLGGAVNASVGHSSFPVIQVLILQTQALEGQRLDGVSV